MVNDVENGQGNQSSDPGRGFVHITWCELLLQVTQEKRNFFKIKFYNKSHKKHKYFDLAEEFLYIYITHK